MMLFVIGGFFRRRRGPRYSRDEMPIDPLIEVLLFWFLFGLGALFGSAALASAFAMTQFGLDRDAQSIAMALIFVALAGVCFWRSVVIWRRMNRAQ